MTGNLMINATKLIEFCSETKPCDQYGIFQNLDMNMGVAKHNGRGLT